MCILCSVTYILCTHFLRLSNATRAHNRLESRYSNSSGGSYDEEKSKFFILLWMQLWTTLRFTEPRVQLQTLQVSVSNPPDYKNRATDGSQLSVHTLTHMIHLHSLFYSFKFLTADNCTCDLPFRAYCIYQLYMLTRALSLRIKEFGTEIMVTTHVFVCVFSHASAYVFVSFGCGSCQLLSCLHTCHNS